MPIFVDTGAWFARFVPSDSDHTAARDWFEQNTFPLITTDYVVDELLTVLKVRNEYPAPWRPALRFSMNRGQTFFLFSP